MAKALYRKWRPQDWDEVVAQEHVITTLRNAVIHDRVGHAYLFAGPRGTGKTTTARLLAKAVNCLEPNLEKRPCNACDHCLSLSAGRFLDLIEIDAASNTSVDDVRDLRDKINFSPSQGKYKIYIIDEVHMLSTAAFNALLKTLEEPPPHAIFILATTEIHKIPATVLSRCQRHEFRRIPLNIIIEHLKEKSKGENIHVTEPVFVEIARQATGSMRDAISLLDQLTSTTENITLEMAQNVLGTATNMSVIKIVDALIAQDAAKGLTQINKALDSGTDPRQLARQLVSYLRNVLLFKMGNNDQVDVPEDVHKEIHKHADQIPMHGLLRAIEAFNDAAIQEHGTWHPGLGLELAITNYLTEPESYSAEKYQPIKKQPDKPVDQKPENPKPKPQPPSKKEAEQKSEQKSEEQSPLKKSEEKPPSKKQPQHEDNNLIDKPEFSQETDPSAEPQTKDTITLNNLHRSWKKIKSMVGKHNPRTEGLLNSSKLAGLKENTLMLGFSSETLKEMMEKEGNITLTADILEEVFGQTMVIKCIVTTHQGSALPDNVKIDKDGMVSTATRDLGGKINSAEEAK